MVEGVHGSLDRRDAVALALLGLIGVGIPLWLAAAAGAIGVPAIDDWTYMWGAESLFRSGVVDMPGHTAAAIGQLVIVQPLLWLSGGGRWAFTAFGLIMTLIGVVATYLLARRRLGMGSAVMVVLLVEAFPGFARISATFMTDVPALALAVLSVYLGTRWLDGGRRLTLVASLAVGLVGLSIREFAIAAPLSVLVAGWARSRPEDRSWLVGTSAAFVTGVALVLVAVVSMPGRGVSLTDGGLAQVILIGPAFTTLAAVLLPAVALGLGRRLTDVRPAQLILGFGLVGFVLVMPLRPLVGDLWMSTGVVGNALLSGIRDPVIGVPAWGWSQQLALFAAGLLAALALRWFGSNLAPVGAGISPARRLLRIARSADGVLILFVVFNGFELAVFATINGILDRYLFPLVPAAAILLLQGQGPSSFGRRHASAHAAFAWLAISAAVVALNSFAYDGARWRAGEAAVNLGYAATAIDGGYEWVGYHAGEESVAGKEVSGRSWYYDRIPADQPCAVISNSPLDDDALRLIRVNATAYRQYLFFGPEGPLYLYGAVADGCPPLPGSSAATQAP